MLPESLQLKAPLHDGPGVELKVGQPLPFTSLFLPEHCFDIIEAVIILIKTIIIINIITRVSQ